MLCYLLNVHDLLADGKTPYERRFGEPFEGTRLHFGAMVIRQESIAWDFFGYELMSGEIWKGHILVPDFKDLEKLDVPEIYLEESTRKKYC